jgi:hypothetical protein
MADKKDVLQIPVVKGQVLEGKPVESLDVIRASDGTFIFAIAERGPVQRRTLVTISKAHSVALAHFLAGIAQIVPDTDPTK